MSSSPRKVQERRGGNTLVVVLVILLVPAVAIGGWIYYRQSGDSTASDETPVTQVAFQGDFDHVVVEQGEVESSSNNEVKCQVEARGSSGTPVLWVIDEGSYVKVGDKLVELDSSALENELKGQRIVVSAAEASVISADAAVRQAVIAREEYLQGTYQTERKAILSEIAVAEQEKRKAELSLASAERMAAKGTLRPLQIQAEQFAVRNAKNVLESAQSRLKVLDELTKEKMLVELDSAIETARAQLESFRSTQLEEKTKLEELEEQIRLCTILSPAEGQVVHANEKDRRGGSEFVLEPGATVREQQTLILLPDPNKMQVRAKINESRITLISEGMPARLQVGPASLLGRVTKVNKYAEAGSFFSSSVKEYATLVQIFDPPESIRTGMTAEVQIYVNSIDNALQIPILAVYETMGHHLVLVERGPKRYETKEVKIQATNDQFAAIAEGLEEGDRVVLNPRKHLDLMDVPAFEVTDDRGRLSEISQMEMPASQATDDGGPNDPAGQGGEWQQGKGPGGPGGPGGPAGAQMNPAQALEMMFGRLDSDGDGKISKDEAAGNGRLADNFANNDSNSDGFVDRKEMSSAMQKMRPPADR